MAVAVRDAPEKRGHDGQGDDSEDRDQARSHGSSAVTPQRGKYASYTVMSSREPRGVVCAGDGGAAGADEAVGGVGGVGGATGAAGGCVGWIRAGCTRAT